MAKAYETLAHRGESVTGSLAPYDGGPVTYTKVTGPGVEDKNKVKTKQVVPESVADQATSILQSVVTSGTGRSAEIGEFAAGKTGTTENYQDAWFVGFNDLLTVAVWVGYPEGAKPMETEYHGQPVAGGTYPAEIWHDFMLTVKNIRDTRAVADGEGATGPTGVPAVPVAPVTPEPVPDEPKPKGKGQDEPGTGGGAPEEGDGQQPVPEPAPEPPVQPPAQPPQPPTDPGGTGGAGGGGAAPPPPGPGQ